jgi:hypothetical protein
MHMVPLPVRLVPRMIILSKQLCSCHYVSERQKVNFRVESRFPSQAYELWQTGDYPKEEYCRLASELPETSLRSAAAIQDLLQASNIIIPAESCTANDLNSFALIIDSGLRALNHGSFLKARLSGICCFQLVRYDRIWISGGKFTRPKFTVCYL